MFDHRDFHDDGINLPSYSEMELIPTEDENPFVPQCPVDQHEWADEVDPETGRNLKVCDICGTVAKHR